MILTDATIREQTYHHDFSFFEKLVAFLQLSTPWILGSLVHSDSFAGGMSTSSWSAATPNTTASITEFSYKGVSPTEAGSFLWQKIDVRLFRPLCCRLAVLVVVELEHQHPSST